MSVPESLANLTLQIGVEKWPLKAPFTNHRPYFRRRSTSVIATVSCRGPSDVAKPPASTIAAKLPHR